MFTADRNKIIREKLKKAHEQENEYNIEIGNIDKQITKLHKRKVKLAKLISGNMKHRNMLIKNL
jgi:hypothetical protein